MRAHGPAIKQIIERSGYSQAKFASAVGMSPGQLSEIIKGTKGASPDLLKRMATELKCPITALICDPECAVA